MTTKEIAVATSKPERTVHNWVKRTSAKMAQVYAKMAQALESKKPADYDLDETCAIIETGLGKNAADLYRMNARGVPASQSALTEKDLDLITKLTAGIVAQVMANLDSRVHQIESRIEERQTLLPPPQMSPESHINMLVRNYVYRTGESYSSAWGKLYQSMYYIYHRDIKRLKGKSNKTGLQIAIEGGFIGEMESLAMDMFKELPA